MTHEIPLPRRPDALETDPAVLRKTLQELLSEFGRVGNQNNYFPDKACLDFDESLVAMAGWYYAIVLIADDPYTIVCVVEDPGNPQYDLQSEQGDGGLTHTKLTLKAKTFRFVVNRDYARSDQREEVQNAFSLREAHYSSQAGTGKNFNQKIDNIRRRDITVGGINILDGLPYVVRKQVVEIIDEIDSKIRVVGSGVLDVEMVKQ